MNINKSKNNLKMNTSHTDINHTLVKKLSNSPDSNINLDDFISKPKYNKKDNNQIDNNQINADNKFSLKNTVQKINQSLY